MQRLSGIVLFSGSHFNLETKQNTVSFDNEDERERM